MIPDALALAGSPQEWAALAAVIVIVFAPRLLPPIARMASRHFAREMRRRLGLPEEPANRSRRPGRASSTGPTSIEVLPPERPQPTLRATDPRPIAPEPRLQPHGARPLWQPAVLVTAVVAVLLWYLLHTR